MAILDPTNSKYKRIRLHHPSTPRIVSANGGSAAFFQESSCERSVWMPGLKFPKSWGHAAQRLLLSSASWRLLQKLCMWRLHGRLWGSTVHDPQHPCISTCNFKVEDQRASFERNVCQQLFHTQCPISLEEPRHNV